MHDMEVKNIKLKEWIRNKLVKFVKLDDIQEHLLSEIRRLDKEYDNLSREINNSNKNIANNREDIDILHNTIKSVVSVGADVYPNAMNRDRSWAVVCIEGRCNIIKFIDMYGADYKYIMDFLKQFEGSRMVIDAPNSKFFEDMFEL